jgi:hypothetical protein
MYNVYVIQVKTNDKWEDVSVYNTSADVRYIYKDIYESFFKKRARLIKRLRGYDLVMMQGEKIVIPL